jgi:GDPmannose 4,6-dehydratase
VDILVGDASKAKQKLGWHSKTSFRELVKIMVRHDFEEITGKKKSLNKC